MSRIKRVASPEICNRLAGELPFCVFDAEWGLTYQICRFCDRGLGEVPHRHVSDILGERAGLFKYGTRHYICADCKTHFSRFAGLVAGRKGERTIRSSVEPDRAASRNIGGPTKKTS